MNTLFRRRIVPLGVLLLVLFAPFATADPAAPLVLTYEAPGADVPVGSSSVRLPELNGWDPTEGALTWDGRVDAGRLFAYVPDGAERLTFSGYDSAHQRVPVRVETYKATGALVASETFCMRTGQTEQLDLNHDPAIVVFRLNALDTAGACPTGTIAGATRGTIVVTFSA